MTWGLSSLGIDGGQQLRIVHQIALWDTPATGNQLSFTLLKEKLREVNLETDRLPADLHELKARGEIAFTQSGEQIGEITILDPGKTLAAQVEITRNSQIARKRYVRVRYLRWLNETQDSGRTVDPKEFLVANPDFLGCKLVEDDVDSATAWLSAQGYLRPTTEPGVSGQQSRRLTKQGITEAEALQKATSHVPERIQFPEKQYLGTRTLLATGSVLLLVSPAVFNLIELTIKSRIVLAAGCVVTGLLLAWLYFRLSKKVRRAPDLGDGPVRSSSTTDHVLSAVPAVQAKMTGIEVDRFLRLIVTPEVYFKRISESVQPLTRSVSVLTSFSLEVPAAPGNEVIVPVALSQRGRLDSGLQFHDGEGNRLTSLARTESQTYLLAVVRCIVVGFGLPTYWKYLEYVEPFTAEIVTSSAEVPTWMVSDVVEAFKQLPGVTRELEGMTEALSSLLRRVGEGYPICLPLVTPREDAPDASEVSVAGQESGPSQKKFRFRIDMKSRVIIEFQENFHKGSGLVKKWVDVARLSFGIRPLTLRWPLKNANRTSSYHLQLVGPERTYLAAQAVLAADGREFRPPNATVQPRRGQRHAHLYVRDGRGYLGRSYRAQFYERMPGSMGAATMSAASVAILVWLGYLAASMSFSEWRLFPSWEYVAIVLAFPSAISLWVGVEGDRKLMEGVLVAKVSTFVTIGIAGLAAFLNITTGARPQDTLWISLGVVAVVNALVAWASWLSRAHLQSWFIGQRKV